MEALSALGLIVNILTLCEDAKKVFSQIKRARSPSTHHALQTVVEDFRRQTEYMAEYVGRQGQSHEQAFNGQDRPSRDTEDPGSGESVAIRNLAQEALCEATELSSLLASLSLDERPGGRKRKRDVVGITVKNLRRRGDVERHEKNFSRYSQELALRQGHLMNERLLELQRDIRSLKKTDPDKAKICKWQLKNMDYQIRDSAKCITSSLAYDEMHYREDRIHVAYEDTFDWSCNPSSTHFPTWASQENGVFWLTGKAGSGKSTCMKHLSSDKQVRGALEDWAGGKELVVATHYFWIGGTPIQKSITGLLRSLLIQIFVECPELAPLAAPQRCYTRARDRLPWSEDELYKALHAIAQQPSLQTCFCFFIDGLDEYDGDHFELSNILSSLTRSTHIKMCVSSRPWNPFQRAFGSNPQHTLVMEDLTRNDIKRYIDGKLRDDQDFQTMEEEGDEMDLLIVEIATKAQGVFLWVFLVVRELLKGFKEGDDFATLRTRLKRYPETLDEYFDRMLNSLDTFYKAESARILLCALHLQGPLPLRAPKFICEEVQDPSYAWTMSVHDKPHRREGLDKTRQHLNARCRDLLEFQQDEGCIGFLHRTVIDFLQTKEIHDRLYKNAGSTFEVHMANLKAVLAMIKSEKLGLESSRELYQVIGRCRSSLSSESFHLETQSFADPFDKLLHPLMENPEKEYDNFAIPQNPTPSRKNPLMSELDLDDLNDVLAFLGQICKDNYTSWEYSNPRACTERCLALSNNNDIIMSIKADSYTTYNRDTLQELDQSLGATFFKRLHNRGWPITMLVEESTHDVPIKEHFSFRIIARFPSEAAGSKDVDYTITIAQAVLARMEQNVACS